MFFRVIFFLGLYDVSFFVVITDGSEDFCFLSYGWEWIG